MRNLLVLVLVGCSQTNGSCPDIACADGLELKFSPVTGAFEPGAYELETELEGVIERCSFTIQSDGLLEANPSCVASYGTLIEQPFVSFDLAPVAELRYAIRKDGVELAAARVTPAYALIDFGEDCATCERATVDVSF